MSYTRKSKSKSRSNNKIKIHRNYNNIIENLGKSILQDTTSKNIELLKSIQTSTPILKHEYMDEIISKLTPETISKTISFAALIYKNKKVYQIMKPFLIATEKMHDEYIFSIISSFAPEAEMAGGYEVALNQKQHQNKITPKKMKLFVPWFFILSLFSLLWVSFISYNQLLFIQAELEKNTAFALVKDVGSAAMTCDFNNIHLSREEESIFKIIKYANVIDTKILVNIENTLKLRKCILDPKKTFQTEVFNQNVRPATSYLKIDTNIVPNEIENKKVLSQSLALVPSSSTAMLVPTETMKLYITDYNADLYSNIERKIKDEISSIKNEKELITYFDRMGKIELHDFKSYFEETETETYTENDSTIPSLKDLQNILGIFGGDTNSLFKLFIQNFAGMNIINVVYADYKKRMISIHTELTKKSADLNQYTENIIIDSATLITLLISFKTIFFWFLAVSINFGFASYKLTQYIRQKKPTVINNYMVTETEPEPEVKPETSVIRKTKKRQSNST